MSEQTPDSPGNIQGSSMADGEPSMEDILASIRKIISEDEPVALESPEDVADLKPMTLESDAELEQQSRRGTDVMDEFQDDTPSRDVVDLDLDAMIAKIDMATQEAAAAPVVAEAAASVEPDDEDILAMMDMDIPLEDDIPTTDMTEDDAISSLEAEAMLSEIEDNTPELDASDDDDDMDALLDDILATSDEDEPMEMDLPASVESDPDLDLVKSLMADLSDDIGADTAPGGTEEDYIADLDALLAIPEIEPEPELEAAVEETAPEEASIEETPEAELAASEEDAPEDILGDILDMTLDDEIKNHPDEITPEIMAADEMANVEANAVSEPIDTTAPADEPPSLSEIAAAAEADAQAVEAPMQAPSAVAATAGLVAGTAGVAALGATALGQAKPEDVADDAPQPQAAEVQMTEAEEIAEALESAAAEAEAEPSLDLTPKHTETEEILQEPSMPVKAVNTDTILDDVTEAAAADAFAELNSVVEEKAVFNERGPRIGDLVQEALRPMLKDWLDANLKGIVERAVAKEVKRISTGK